MSKDSNYISTNKICVRKRSICVYCNIWISLPNFQQANRGSCRCQSRSNIGNIHARSSIDCCMKLYCTYLSQRYEFMNLCVCGGLLKMLTFSTRAFTLPNYCDVSTFCLLHRVEWQEVEESFFIFPPVDWLDIFCRSEATLTLDNQGVDWVKWGEDEEVFFFLRHYT